MSMDNHQEKLLYTPRRAQKCLFVPSNGNSCKKNTPQNSRASRGIEVSSGEESDVGPMSPLAFTDRSPSISDSSSGRDFVSPFASPEQSSLHNVPISWDRLTLRHNTEDRISPFSSLKKITRAARYSPRCKLFSGNSPKSLPSSPITSSEPLTPRRSKKMDATMNGIIPETPQRNFATDVQNQSITETPKKTGTPERRQITPLNSITKIAPLPKLHRRKSLGTLETRKSFSPEQKENVLKRHANDQLTTNPAKLFKADNASVSKARAALFQERKNKCRSLTDISLSTKTFYSNNTKIKRPFATDNFSNNDVKKRRSLPMQNNNRRSLMKKQKFGRINAGVFHGIKKPKPKANSEKKTGQPVAQSPTSVTNKSSPTAKAQTVEANVIAERAPSPVIDESKRFFKTNKTIRSYQAATVTVNNKIKLKVSDGKIVLNPKRTPSATKAHKQQAKTANVPLDATDLTVDEPEVEATLEKDKVADLLKILEDDWGDDDYDTMEVMATNIKHNSPIKPLKVQLKETIMSPATELSNMTSTMNIKDGPLTNFGDLSLSNTDNGNNTTRTVEKTYEKKYFPLFTKGYSASDNISDNEVDKANTSKATKSSLQWQLSAKGGGAKNQYQLDAGQKRFGATQCSECNIVYELGNPEDENAHLNYHNSVRTLKFPGWKNERVIMEDPFTSSRIILVEPQDSKVHWKKVSEILAVVDRDLGLADMDMPDYQNKKIFLYIREKSVLGVLVAEPIKMAYRMIPELIELNCCTSESTPTKCGVNVVWTALSHRRQRIATKLIDVLRSKFICGYVMPLDDIAFSIPTPSGKIFAEKYTKTRNFKVYN